jgi:CBS domain-containing protein
VEWTFLSGEIAPIVRSLRRELPAVAAHALGSELARRFGDDPTAPFLVVTEEGDRPVGLVDRRSFLAHYEPGRDEGRPVGELMDADPPIVEAKTPIDEVGQRLFSADPKGGVAGFIVVEDGRYAGIVTGTEFVAALGRSLADANASLREVQGELVQAGTMATLGTLAAGIAQEVNVPIGSALSAVAAFGEATRIFADLAVGGSVRRSDIDTFIASARRATEYLRSTSVAPRT